MKAFMRLPATTQKFAVGAVIALSLLAGGALSWSLHQRAADAQLRVSAGMANREAMRALVQRFESRPRGASTTDLSAFVTRSLQGRNFQPSLIQQQNGELALRFDNAPFAELLTWMRELEESGAVVLGNVSIAQAQPAGVNLTLVLRGG